MLLVSVLLFSSVAQAQATVVITNSFGNDATEQRIRDVAITMDSSYVGSGGEEVLPAAMALVTVYYMDCQPVGGYVFEYTVATSKLKAYWIPNDTNGVIMDEVTATTNMSSTVVTCRVWGTQQS